MLGNIWDTLLYRPLINAMALTVSFVPGGDVGIAIIILTLLVKLLLFPLSQKSIESQAQMAIIAPELDKIKKSGKSKEEQATLTFDLYKKHKTNPFSGCLLLVIQIPIILALYYVFLKGIAVNLGGGLLYSFITPPARLNMIFLGLIDISKKSLILAILAGISQYLQAHFMLKPATPATTSAEPSFSETLTKSMNTQMKYVFPFLIALIAYRSGVVALYLITSTIFTVLQQIYIGRKRHLKLVLE